MSSNCWIMQRSVRTDPGALAIPLDQLLMVWLMNTVAMTGCRAGPVREIKCLERASRLLSTWALNTEYRTVIALFRQEITRSTTGTAPLLNRVLLS